MYLGFTLSPASDLLAKRQQGPKLEQSFIFFFFFTFFFWPQMHGGGAKKGGSGTEKITNQEPSKRGGAIGGKRGGKASGS